MNKNERNARIERERSVAVEKKQIQIENLTAMVEKVNFFSDDLNDEFRIIREDGAVEGIFKTWAVPVIPLMDTDGLVDNDQSNRQEVFDRWLEVLKNNPIRTWETLERWRTITETSDRRLFEIFQRRELPEEKNERMAELVFRLKLAFGFAAPFYHIEAMVADSKKDKINPFEAVRHDGEGGFLDIVGMALPSALSNMVTTERLAWNGLSWEKIREMVEKMDRRDLAVAMRVARAAGITIEDVVFAANVLEWIPVSVGGKRADLEKEEAIDLILGNDSMSGSFDLSRVARDMNGLIRFLNWSPLVRSASNFSDGSGWRYAAVCETANQIVSEIEAGGVLEAEFEKVFLRQIVDQLKNLDASSARGRFVLSLLQEKDKWKDGLLDKIESEWPLFRQEVAKELIEAEENEAIRNIFDGGPRALVGGKVAGLAEARVIFGEESTIEGKVLTTDFVSNWIMENEVIKSMIQTMEMETDIETKLQIGSLVRNTIEMTALPKNIVDRLAISGDMAVRSSSFDEDTLINGTAAGIYESVVPVRKNKLEGAIKSVISSFYSEKAISYRNMHGLSDMPAMAVMVTEFIEGPGGAAFSSGNGDGWKVFVGKDPGKIVSGEDGFDSLILDEDGVTDGIKSAWVNPELMVMMGEMAKEAELMLGGKTDMEFVVGRDGTIRILQLRMLNSHEERQGKITFPANEFVDIERLNELSGLVFGEDSRVCLNIGKQINLDQFQGELFRTIVRNKDKIVEINLSKPVAGTSHFANICINLGIKLSFRK